MLSGAAHFHGQTYAARFQLPTLLCCEVCLFSLLCPTLSELRPSSACWFSRNAWETLPTPWVAANLADSSHTSDGILEGARVFWATQLADTKVVPAFDCLAYSIGLLALNREYTMRIIQSKRVTVDREQLWSKIVVPILFRNFL